MDLWKCISEIMKFQLSLLEEGISLWAVHTDEINKNNKNSLISEMISPVKETSHYKWFPNTNI